MKQEAICNPMPLPDYSVEWGRAPAVERSAWLGEGDFCSCYLVNASYVFRFAKHAAASAAMRVERCLLPILGNHLAVAVPQVEFAGHRDDTGQAMIGYPFLPGAPLERDILERLPAASQARLIAHMAEVARQLHALSPQIISRCGLPLLHPPTHLTDIMRRARGTIWPHLAEPVRQYHAALLDRYAREPSLHTYQPAVLHGDLSPDHFLVDTELATLKGIIDWGDACIGDPAWDLVYIYEDYGPNTLTAFLAHYDSRNARLLERKARVYQQLNNVAYCTEMLAAGDDGELRAAIKILEEQASAGEA